MASESEEIDMYEIIQTQKRSRILKVLEDDQLKPNKVKILAMSRFGLMDNYARKRAWLMMHKLCPNKNAGSHIDQKMINNHKEYHQVLMDVNRSLKRFPPGMDEVERMAMQDQLVNLIVKILINVKGLNYYQGFHDVCVTFLLVLTPSDSYQLLSKLAKTHFIDFLAPNMDATMQLLYIIFAILEPENSLIMHKIREANVEPYFALSWVITWFGHVLNDIPRILRVYDFFLASDPIMPVYLSAAIVLSQEQKILDTETDFAQLHHVLSNLTKSCDLNLEELLSETMRLFMRHPPTKLLHSHNVPYQLASSALGSQGISEILKNARGPLGDTPETRGAIISTAGQPNPRPTHSTVSLTKHKDSYLQFFTFNSLTAYTVWGLIVLFISLLIGWLLHRFGYIKIDTNFRMV